MIKEIDEKEREVMRLKIQNEVLKHELRETEDDLVYALDKLEESHKERTYLDDKIIRWVKGSLIATGNYGYTNLLNSLAKPARFDKGVIFHSGGMLDEKPDDKSKEKEKIIMEDYQLGEICQASTSRPSYADREDLSDVETESDEVEIEKRKKGAVNNIPPPKDYSTVVVSAWKREIQTQSVENKREFDKHQRNIKQAECSRNAEVQAWKKTEAAQFRRLQYQKNQPRTTQHQSRRHQSQPQHKKWNDQQRQTQSPAFWKYQQWKKVENSSRRFVYPKTNQTRVQYGNEVDKRKLRPAQYGRRNHKLNSTQFVKHQYRWREETSRQLQHQKFSQHVWRHHSHQRQPQFHRNNYQTDFHQRLFTRRRPEKKEEMKKKEQKVVPKGAKKKNEERAFTSQQRRNISSSSSRVIRQIWVPKGTTNVQGPKR